jgi:hypothetical protein
MTRVKALVLDTMCLSHFALIERLDVLGELLSGGAMARGRRTG